MGFPYVSHSNVLFTAKIGTTTKKFPRRRGEGREPSHKKITASPGDGNGKAIIPPGGRPLCLVAAIGHLVNILFLIKRQLLKIGSFCRRKISQHCLQGFCKGLILLLGAFGWPLRVLADTEELFVFMPASQEKVNVIGSVL